MRYKTQCECIDKECNTVILGPENRLDGIKCPRCDGPVLTHRYNPPDKSKLSITVNAINLDKVIMLGEVLKGIVDDNRVPADVREEVRDKVNSILEPKDDE
jgi:hypothetical protein